MAYLNVGHYLRIAILGFDGATGLDITGPLEALAAAKAADANEQPVIYYKPLIAGVTGKTFASASGAIFRADTTLEAAPALDTIIIPGGPGVRHHPVADKISKWLQKRSGTTRRIAAISTGIYALAPSGLLDGREVTTHWRYTTALAREFPKLKVNYRASFVKDGDFYTSGGGTGGMEMTLSMIEQDHGAAVALAAARELLLELKPPGNEGLRAEDFDYQLGPEERLADLPAWIVAHLRDNLSVEALAERACLCSRHFSRLFKERFKTTPADFVEELRLKEARRRLLLPRYSVASAASSVGFRSSDAFRRAFERRFGVGPREFRQRFHLRTVSENDSPFHSSALAR